MEDATDLVGVGPPFIYPMDNHLQPGTLMTSINTSRNLTSSDQGALTLTAAFVTDDGLLRLCPGVTDYCGEFGWEIACTTSHIVAIIINIFHIVILKKMNNELTFSLLNILMNISLADILSSFSLIMKINCAIHHLSDGKPRLITALLSASTDVGPVSRVYILALAAWERMVAMCYSQDYQTHVLVSRNMVCVASMWLFVTAAIFLRDFIFNETHCLTAILGVGNYYAVEPKAIIFTLMLIPTLVIGVLVVILARKQRGVQGLIDAGEQSTILRQNYADTKYILILCVLFYISYLPTLMSFVLLFLKIKFLVFNWVIVLMFAIYGVGNIALYGVLSRAYQLQILKSCCLHGTTSTAPDSQIIETVI